jgi:membrane protease YdiL (CAAX protease family)
MAAATARAKGGSAGGKLVSVMSWCVAVYTTAAFIKPLTQAGAIADVLLWSALLQAVFTWGESAIWRGQGSWWNYAVLVLDTITNVGGIFFLVTRLDQTDSWAAFNQGLGTQGGLAPMAALLLSAALGIMVAAAPEFLWRKG